ncbi:hypothetical protein R1sor_016724 [Riccia sorocarpa]|uniref:NB-ARC domain-containing protein n=1 Tax=Riccia sorocarpa TaxID=122646 RepID=A0ABD3HJD9_9MARC
MDLYRITENLLQEIAWARKERDCDRPMILVGHGFGGIVMKQLCVHAHNRKEDLVGGKDEFCKLKQLERYRWIIFAVAGQDSTLGRPGLRLPEGSSRFGDNYITVTSSHFCVCRPSDKTSNEYQHLQTLIQNVLMRVESERKPYLPVPKVIVGFDGLIYKVLKEQLPKHKFVGICGMGGIGKTTLAKLIFNEACVNFEFTCFVEDIKGLSGPPSKIKKTVWKQMRHRGVPVRKADAVYEDVWYQVKGKLLLFILDDVDNGHHVDLLQEIATITDAKKVVYLDEPKVQPSKRR